MTDPDRLPLRVLLKGDSRLMYTSWMGGPRSDLAIPRVIEAELYAAGWPADVRCTAVPGERTKEAIRGWEQEVLAWSPDVVVLVYGEMDCVHRFIPKALERHVNSVRGRPFRVRKAYRKHLLLPVWKMLRRMQREIDGRLPPTFGFHPERIAADLEYMIARVRSVASPLVLIPEHPPAGAVYAKWFPGLNPRMAVVNETLRDLVARLDQPDVRIAPFRGLLADRLAAGEEICPDGGHFTPEINRQLGEELAEMIIGWAAQQPHLDLDTYRARRPRLSEHAT